MTVCVCVHVCMCVSLCVCVCVYASVLLFVRVYMCVLTVQCLRFRMIKHSFITHMCYTFRDSVRVSVVIVDVLLLLLCR